MKQNAGSTVRSSAFERHYYIIPDSVNRIKQAFSHIENIDMDELEFKRLIEKYQEGLLSGDERALLDQWFEVFAKDGNTVEWTEAEKATLKRKILSRVNADRKNIFMDGARKNVLSSRSVWHTSFRVAAAILLFVAVSYGVQQWHERGKSEETAMLRASAVENINKVILADGTIVWLKGRSTLTYPQEFTGNARHVTLVGEALFEVAKDPVHPFIIQCGELITTVLGTSFNIKASEERIEVAVLTGKVFLTSRNETQKMIVLPNEKASYSVAQRKIAKVASPLKPEETSAAVAGTDYVMDFEDAKMEEVIHRIEGKFDVQVKIDDPKLRNCMITGDFTGQSLERTLKMIAQALSFDYDINNGGVILHGGGCNQ